MRDASAATTRGRAGSPADRLKRRTVGDYVNSRYVLNPLRLWDCDRPVNASAAYLFTTAERARDMRQPPVYVLNHSQHNFRQRTTQADLDEIERSSRAISSRSFI